VAATADERAALAVRARADLARLRTPQGWLEAGRPRYRRLFGRDACITGWQRLHEDPDVAVASLRALAARQGRTDDPIRDEEPGKIPHEVPVRRLDLAASMVRKRFRWRFPNFSSVDATLWWLLLLGRVAPVRPDLVDELWPVARAARQWVASFGDGFVTYRPGNPHGLQHHGWRDDDFGPLGVRPPVALVEVQGYAVAALRSFAELADARDEREAADDARAQADRLRDDVRERFAWPEEGYYALAIDGEGRAVRMVSSNAGHLLFTGALDRGATSAVAARLAEPDLTTAFGLRCHSAEAPAYDPMSYHRGSIWPHDTWIVHEGLRATGHHELARTLREGVLAACVALDAIPECWGVVDDRPVPIRRAQPVQAWSAAAVLHLLSVEDDRPDQR
jgi:glycogen debranching enzyme